MPPYLIEWQEQRDDEAIPDYVKRCLATPSDFGLVCGHHQIGKRVKRDPSVPLMRTWLVEQVPGTLTSEQVLQALGSTFKDVTMLYQRRKGDCMSYTFRGKTSSEHDSLAIPLDYDGGACTLWARWAPPRKGKAPPQHIHVSGAWSLMQPKTPFSTELRTSVAEPGDGEDDVAAAGGVDHLMGNDTTGGHPKPTKAPVAKRQCQEQRKLPDGVTVNEAAKDGNCLFTAVAEGLDKLSPQDTPRNAAELRAKVVRHLRKHEKEYTKGWDWELPNKSKATSWEEYVGAMEVDGTWGGLPELRALSRLHDVRIVVFPTIVSLSPFSIHNRAKKVVALRFTGSHYDLLCPIGPKLPKCLLEVTDPEVPARGGGAGDGSDDAGRAGSGATVWTASASTTKAPAKVCQPAASQATVWTGPAGPGFSSTWQKCHGAPAQVFEPKRRVWVIQSFEEDGLQCWASV